MVLVKGLDIPSTCHTCKLGKTSCINSDTICVVTSSKATYEESEIERMLDCPLQELPKYIKGDPRKNYVKMYKAGYNACLDNILGN